MTKNKNKFSFRVKKQTNYSKNKAKSNKIENNKQSMT